MACGKKEVVKIDVDVDEEEDNTIRCINCRKEIEGKPWITVGCGKDPSVHACGYSCSNRLKYYVGVGYWHRVLNKEDFPGPRPVMKASYVGDITANFGIEDIRREIEDEEVRIEMMEECDSDDSSSYYDDY
jgi:hypothetical protein|tara:strand:+ start:172 stop:564 length:393 start_codon:yes stop_codon:yes gene_type:complete